MKSDKLIKTDSTYIGIDQSLTCTSICVYKNQKLSITRIKPDIKGPKRLRFIFDEVVAILAANNNDSYVAIEGYAFNAKGMYFNLGEVGGVIRLACEQGGFPLVQVPPTTLKKFITGSGKATKNIIIKELYKNYELDIDDDNDADAASLAILCREYFETKLHIVNAYQTDLHKACDQIIGVHPLIMTPEEYLKDMPNGMKIHEYEKMKKAKK
jgi:crossover junction endodeoxyribonuclease RuvC